VTARLDALDSTYEEARTHLQECLALAGDCQTVYACGSDTTRRMANRAFFTRVYLDPSLSTSGETLTIEDSVTLRARTENAGHAGYEHEWSWAGG
jgi:hypothetical protein